MEPIREQLTITNENRKELRQHAIIGINKFIEGMQLLKIDLNNKDEFIADAAIFITATLLRDAEQSIINTTEELKKHERI